MTLTEELKAKKDASAKNIPSEKYSVMQGSTQELKDVNLSKGAKKAGDHIVAFELPNINGAKVKSAELLEKGPLVISFYRGGWCPYCNMELRALQQILPELKEMGVELVAISPETPDNSLSTSEKNDLEFEVLSDIGNQYAKQMGLVFQMPEALREVYHSFNLDVPKHNGNDDYELPMPATYIISQKGEVLYDFVPEDYTERLDPEVILQTLKEKEVSIKS